MHDELLACLFVCLLAAACLLAGVVARAARAKAKREDGGSWSETRRRGRRASKGETRKRRKVERDPSPGAPCEQRRNAKTAEAGF